MKHLVANNQKKNGLITSSPVPPCLQPLCEIAPHKQHPVYQKSTQALLDTCEDNTPLSIHELGCDGWQVVC